MPLLCSLRISVQSIYWATIFSSSIKPIIITLLCPDANPRDKLSQSIISFQLLFCEKSPKLMHKNGHLLTVRKSKLLSGGWRLII